MRAQSCLTLWDPIDYSLPVSSVPEFSRQEYWSGLPFPKPVDSEGEKNKEAEHPASAEKDLRPQLSVQFSSVVQSCLTP